MLRSLRWFRVLLSLTLLIAGTAANTTARAATARADTTSPTDAVNCEASTWRVKWYHSSNAPDWYGGADDPVAVTCLPSIGDIAHDAPLPNSIFSWEFNDGGLPNGFTTGYFVNGDGSTDSSKVSSSSTRMIG